MKLLIDIGNTSSKLAVTQGDDVLHMERLTEPWATALERLHRDYTIDTIVVSCVGKEGPALREALKARGDVALWLTSETNCAISGVPAGYGADRLAADLGAYTGQHALLVIDAGTCITYDLIIDGRLVGGVISPGVQLRLNAMHDYTALLPQIEVPHTNTLDNAASTNLADTCPNVAIMANNTEECMLSAAIYGAIFEAEGYIRALLQEYPDLCVVQTGGNRLQITTNLPYRYDPMLVLCGLNTL